MIQPFVSLARPIPPILKRIGEAVVIATGAAFAAWGVEELKGVVNRRRERLRKEELDSRISYPPAMNRQEAANLPAVAPIGEEGDSSAAPTDETPEGG